MSGAAAGPRPRGHLPPGTDGLTLTRRLKQDPGLADIPFVALTAYAMDEDRANALEAGCAGFISKPIDTRAFPGQVLAFLEGDTGR